MQYIVQCQVGNVPELLLWKRHYLIFELQLQNCKLQLQTTITAELQLKIAITDSKIAITITQ